MASTEQELRREIREERAKLAEAVDELRSELGEAADLKTKVRQMLPLLAGGAFGLGFFTAGGIGATARLLMRRGREGHERAAIGRYRVIDRG